MGGFHFHVQGPSEGVQKPAEMHSTTDLGHPPLRSLNPKAQDTPTHLAKHGRTCTEMSDGLV